MSRNTYTVIEGDPQQIIEYESIKQEDAVLIESFDLDTTLNQGTDNVELHIYSLDQRLLFSNEVFKDFTVLRGGSRQGEVINDITLNPETDAINAGYGKGDVNLLYNFTKNLYSDTGRRPRFYINEISSDRTEVKLVSNELIREEIERFTNNVKERLSTNSIFQDFRLNFGENKLSIGINIDLEEFEDTFSVLVKLYEPLPPSVQVKDLLRLEELVSDSVLFKVVSLQETQLTTLKKLRQPNFNVEVLEDSTIPSSYLSYSDLIGYPISGSFYQVFSEANKKGINLNIDYTNYASFINFSSAEERLKNFRYKLQLLESYNQSIKSLSTGSLQATGSYSQLIEGVINNFDHYENHLYYNSGSYSWPKTSSEKPFKLAHTTSSAAITWYSNNLLSSSFYDATNTDLLTNTIPSYISDDPDNASYLLFVDMIAQHFDNLWIYANELSNRYDADNRLDSGISKDLVRDALQNFGIKLYENNESLDNLFNFFVGEKFVSGSTTFSVDIVAKNDYLKEVYKRIYHNLPYLTKSKGSFRGLRALINCFGIPEDILKVKVYGGIYERTTPYLGTVGSVSSSLDKIRTDQTSSIVDNILSYYSSTDDAGYDYSNDIRRIDVGFNINDNFNQFILENITGSFRIDDYIGDPGLSYSSSYKNLNLLFDTLQITGSAYFEPFNVTDFVNFTRFYNNTIFRMVKDFTPARANLSTGIIVEQPILSRNKIKETEVAWEFSDYTGSLSVSEITGSDGGGFGSEIQSGKIIDRYSSSYNDYILLPSGGAISTPNLHGNEQAKFTGEFSGSTIDTYKSDLTLLNTFKKQDLSDFSFRYRPVLGFQTFPFLVVTGSANTASACIGTQSTTLYGRDSNFELNTEFYTDNDGQNVYIDSTDNNYISNLINSILLSSESGQRLNTELLPCPDPPTVIFNLLRNSSKDLACTKTGTPVSAIGYESNLVDNTVLYFSGSNQIISGGNDYFTSSSLSDAFYLRINQGVVVETGLCPAIPTPAPTVAPTPAPTTPAPTAPPTPAPTPAPTTPAPTTAPTPPPTPAPTAAPTAPPTPAPTPAPSATPAPTAPPTPPPTAPPTPPPTPPPTAPPTPPPTPAPITLTAFTVYIGDTVAEACSLSNSGTLYGNSATFSSVTQWYINAQGDAYNLGGKYVADGTGQYQFVEFDGQPLFTTNCPTPAPTTAATLVVYAKAEIGNDVTTIQYSVNGGTYQTAFSNNLDTNCTSRVTISGLNQGNSVTFKTSNNDPLSGSASAAACPGAVGLDTTFTVSSLSIGINNVSLTIDNGASVPTPAPTPPPTPPPTPAPVSTFAFNAAFGVSEAAACAATPSTTIYGNNSVFKNVTVFYQDSAGNTVFNGGNNYWSADGDYALIDTIGNILDSGDCPTPAPTPPPTPPPTPAPVIQRQFFTYTDCNTGTSTLNVFLDGGGTPPNVVKFAGTCFEYQSTAGSGTTDVSTLDSYSTCFLCGNSITPAPTVAPTPAPTPAPTTPAPTISANEFATTALPGNGDGSSSTACSTFLGFSLYSTRTDASNITAGDIVYSSAGGGTFNGGNLWYAVGNTGAFTGVKALLINSSGTVITTSLCL